LSRELQGLSECATWEYFLYEGSITVFPNFDPSAFPAFFCRRFPKKGAFLGLTVLFVEVVCLGAPRDRSFFTGVQPGRFDQTFAPLDPKGFHRTFLKFS